MDRYLTRLAAPAYRSRYSGRRGQRGDLLLLAVFPLVVYAPVVTNYWLGDDPAILQHLLEFGVWSNFVDPEVWRAYSPANFTPLLFVSFAIDLELFGLSPFCYYWHQLFCIAASSVLGFCLLRTIMERWVAVLVVLLVVLSQPIGELAGSLMTRHYLDGLVLLLSSAWVFRLAVERGAHVLYWVSALLYLFAAFGKEIYVLAPLLFFAVLWARSDGSSQKAFLPFLAAGICYGLFRVHMLGWSGAAAGYGDLYLAAKPASGMDIVGNIFATLTGFGGVARSMALVSFWLCGVAAVLARRHLNGLVILVASAVAAWTPVLFLLPNLSDRYLLMPTVWFLSLCGLGVDGSFRFVARGAFVRTALSAAAVCLLLFPPMLGSDGLVHYSFRERASAEGHYIWGGPSSTVLVEPISPPWYHRSLAWLRAEVGDGGKAPLVCYDTCACDLAGVTEILAYRDGALRSIALDKDECQTFDSRAMRVKMSYLEAEGALYWQLGPEREGQWFMAQAPEFFVREIPAKGRIPFLYQRPISVRFVFASVEGWRTASPVLNFGGERNASGGALELSWQRE